MPETPIETLYREVRQALGEHAGMVQPPSGTENSEARLREYAPGIAMYPVRTPTLPPATHTNCYLVGTGDVVIVDPASPYADEQAALDRLVDRMAEQGSKVVEIWLTHHHVDHVGGAAHLAGRLGVPVAAHARTAELLATRVTVSRWLEDGEVRELAGTPPRRLRAVYTPGHAPGHMCFVEEHTGVMIAGDMVAGVGTILVEPGEGNMNRYLQSLQHMKELGPTALLPAHGNVIADAAGKIDEYIRHRLWREAQVVSALGRVAAATAGELVPMAYADVAPAVYPLAERSLVAHLIKLVEDGRAERDGDRWRLCA